MKPLTITLQRSVPATRLHIFTPILKEVLGGIIFTIGMLAMIIVGLAL
jgi:hypothetical protein